MDLEEELDTLVYPEDEELSEDEEEEEMADVDWDT